MGRLGGVNRFGDGAPRRRDNGGPLFAHIDSNAELPPVESFRAFLQRQRPASDAMSEALRSALEDSTFPFEGEVNGMVLHARRTGWPLAARRRLRILWSRWRETAGRPAR